MKSDFVFGEVSRQTDEVKTLHTLHTVLNDSPCLVATWSQVRSPKGNTHWWRMTHTNKHAFCFLLHRPSFSRRHRTRNTLISLDLHWELAHQGHRTSPSAQSIQCLLNVDYSSVHNRRLHLLKAAFEDRLRHSDATMVTLSPTNQQEPQRTSSSGSLKPQEGKKLFKTNIPIQYPTLVDATKSEKKLFVGLKVSFRCSRQISQQRNFKHGCWNCYDRVGFLTFWLSPP